MCIRKPSSSELQTVFKASGKLKQKNRSTQPRCTNAKMFINNTTYTIIMTQLVITNVTKVMTSLFRILVTVTDFCVGPGGHVTLDVPVRLTEMNCSHGIFLLLNHKVLCSIFVHGFYFSSTYRLFILVGTKGI